MQIGSDDNNPVGQRERERERAIYLWKCVLVVKKYILIHVTKGPLFY